MADQGGLVQVGAATPLAGVLVGHRILAVLAWSAADHQAVIAHAGFIRGYVQPQ